MPSVYFFYIYGTWIRKLYCHLRHVYFFDALKINCPCQELYFHIYFTINQVWFLNLEVYVLVWIYCNVIEEGSIMILYHLIFLSCTPRIIYMQILTRTYNLSILWLKCNGDSLETFCSQIRWCRFWKISRIFSLEVFLQRLSKYSKLIDKDLKGRHYIEIKFC